MSARRTASERRFSPVRAPEGIPDDGNCFTPRTGDKPVFGRRSTDVERFAIGAPRAHHAREAAIEEGISAFDDEGLETLELDFGKPPVDDCDDMLQQPNEEPSRRPALPPDSSLVSANNNTKA